VYIFHMSGRHGSVVWVAEELNVV
jgi:hypothetical protein